MKDDADDRRWRIEHRGSRTLRSSILDPLPSASFLIWLVACLSACYGAPEQEGLALLAAGKPVEALAKFAQMDSEREGVRKAELLCKAAGDLRVEDPDPWLDQAKVLLERKGTASELLRELQLTRQAVEYVRLRGYDASKRKTLMGFYERLSAADNMLKTLPADSPFSDLAALWRGRIHLWRAREGGHNEGYKIAKEIFARLKEKYPDHRLIRMYLGEQVPSLVTYKLEVPESAPEWAVKAREALVRATDVFHWWVEHRQIETGEMGGGWGDDCEMLRNWPIAILAGDDGLVRVGWRKLAHGIWENGGIFRGYARGMTDVEHGAEDIGDTHAAMIGLDYGNPAFVSRCLMPMKQMRDVWTGLNPQGHRHFKSHYFSATEVRAHKGDDTDTCYCARATQPGIWAAWYSRNPALLALFREYAAGWVAHLDRTDADKPPGVIPGNIRFATDQTGEYAPWFRGYFGWDFEAYSLMYEFLFAAYALTGDPTLESGITDTLAFCQKHLLSRPPYSERVGPATLTVETSDKVEGAAALRMEASQSGGGLSRIFPPVDMTGKEFALRVKPLDGNLKRVTVSFFEHEGDRAARHSYEKFRIGEWNTLRVLAGQRAGTDSWERNRGDLTKVGRIHFYADVNEDGKPMRMLWDGFVQTSHNLPQVGNLREVREYEESFDRLPGFPEGSAQWAAPGLMAQVRPAAEKWRVFTGRRDYDALLRRFGSPYMRWLLSDNRKDKALVASSCDGVIRSTQFNRELLTSEVLFTDRVFIGSTDPVLSLYTGSVGASTYYPMHAVSWENVGQDVAALVADNRTDGVKLLAYNFGKDARHVGLRFWRLAPGTYSWRVGPDANGDDALDSVAESRTFRVNERGERARLSLPARQVTVLEVQQTSAAKATSPLPDVAVAAEEVVIYPFPPVAGEPADIFVPVHNLGPVATKAKCTVEVVQDGRSDHPSQRVDLPACDDLSPVFQTIHMKRAFSAAKTRVIIAVALDGSEITKDNNLALLTVEAVPRVVEDHLALPPVLLKDPTSFELLRRFARLEQRRRAGHVPAALAGDLIEDIRLHQSDQSRRVRDEWEPLLARLEEMRRPETFTMQKVAEIEAESFPRMEGLSATVMEGASGGKAIALTNPNGFLAATLRLQTGVYRILVRGRGPTFESDGFYLSLSGAGERRSYLPRPEWCESDAIIFALTESREYELRIRLAEPGVVVDKVTIEAVSRAGASLPTRLGERNHVLNAGFEDVADGALAPWSLARKSVGTFEPDGAVRRGGKFSVKLTPRILPESESREHAIQQVLMGDRLPRPGQYLFEVWVRVSSEYSAAPPSAAVNHYGKTTRNWHVATLDASAPRNEWLPLRTMVHLPDETDRVFVQLKAYGQQGCVWFDDASLRAVEDR